MGTPPARHPRQTRQPCAGLASPLEEPELAMDCRERPPSDGGGAGNAAGGDAGLGIRPQQLVGKTPGADHPADLAAAAIAGRDVLIQFC